jgi:single-strand selective monofunctional uracil DNA glycosylase
MGNPSRKIENTKSISEEFIAQIEKLSDAVDTFKPDIDGLTIYNPLVYARKSLEHYVQAYLKPSAKVVLLGMNPGPFGMAQTGVPFGDISMVRDWMGISAPVDRPPNEHPKRPILGFACPRSEVSGSRLWGWAKEKYTTPESFFSQYFVWNYCPLVFMEESGANKTPDKLSKSDQAKLFAHCDRTLLSLVEILKPDIVIGVGKFAMKRADNAVGSVVKVSDILHPSPASPKANKNWKGEVEQKLSELGVL